MEVDNCVVSFSFKTDQTTGVCTVYVSGSVQTDYSWTLNRKILKERAFSLPLLCFPQDIYKVCAAVCVGFTAYITRTTFIGFHFSTWVSRPSMKMKAEVEILFGPTFQELRSILVESKFKKPPGLSKAKVLPFKNTSLVHGCYIQFCSFLGKLN